jgi:hypothetical protein
VDIVCMAGEWLTAAANANMFTYEVRSYSCFLGQIGDELYFLACFDSKTRMSCENRVVVICRNFLVPKYLLPMRTVHEHYVPNKVWLYT